MVPNLKPYPAMKASGVEWLGEVPQHWTVQPIGRIGQLYKGNGGNKGDEVPAGVPCVRYGDLYTRHEFFIRSTKGYVAEERAADYTPIRYGDVLFAASGETVEDIGRSAVNLMQVDARCGGDILLLRPTAVAIAEFLGYAAGCVTSCYQKARMGRGFTIVHIYGSQLKRLMLPLPPPSEQVSIVRFLDHADRRIRRYIRAKQKLIKLLEEQKQAIIHRAVTRGLDPNVRLKPSGVEWLGDVPEHWEVNQIRSISHVVRGGSPRPAGSPLYFHGSGAPWITVGEITKDAGMYLTSTATRLTPAGAERSRMIEPGTLLLTNSGATLGKPKISLIQGCINDGVAAFLNLRDRVVKEFLCLYWSTQTVHLRAWVDLGAQPNLNTQIIGSWPVPLPPLGEQEGIVKHIARSTAVLAAAVDRASREIRLLSEYRTRLIADVVTGKLNVRATQLPDEFEESESLQEVDPIPDAEDDAFGAAEATIEEAEA
jgi:type I restriction enzyme S subunit